MSAHVALRKVEGSVSLFPKTHCNHGSYYMARGLWPIDFVKTPLMASERSWISVSHSPQTGSPISGGALMCWTQFTPNQKVSRMTRSSKPNFLQRGHLSFTCSEFFLILLEHRTKQKIFTQEKTKQKQKPHQSLRVHFQVCLQSFFIPTLNTQPRPPAPESVQDSRQVHPRILKW